MELSAGVGGIHRHRFLGGLVECAAGHEPARRIRRASRQTGEEGSRQHPAVQAVPGSTPHCWTRGHRHGFPVGGGTERVRVDAFGGKLCSVVTPEGQRTRIVFGGLASG